MRFIKVPTVVLLFFLLACSGQHLLVNHQNLSVDQKIDSLLSRMTLEEKIGMTHGNTKFSTAGVQRLGIPDLMMSDGPHGVREEIKPHSWEPAGWTNDSSSYFPTGTALSATWNPDLAYRFGQALGQEARARKKDIILGPGINIMRTPLCGRNFEYMGEDPYLVTRMVVPYIKGVQEQDVAACLKHYALNNQEFERNQINAKLSERALREIYLPGYEAAVRDAEVLTVMSAYNKVRGFWCSENSYLLNDILKGEWKFSGIVISDWAGTHSTVSAANAGLDIEMGTNKPYNEFYFADPLMDAVQKGEVSEKTIDDKVRRILKVMFKSGVFKEDRAAGSFVTKEHFDVARAVAEEAVVLLKNDNNLLPLNIKKIKSIAVIGDNATRKHAAGGGSSGLKALYEITPLEGLKNKITANTKIEFSQGYKKTSKFTWDKGVLNSFNPEEAQKLRQEAVSAAAKSEVVIVFAGLNHDFDTEGIDRKDMVLPYEQDILIKEISEVNPNTVVVLISGSPVEMPWHEKVPSILQGWYAGMEAGNVFADILFGDVNPSGKLTFTFPNTLEDSPAHTLGTYPGRDLQSEYSEDILVGYRWFDTKNIDPLFPFGHGLSYSTFEYRDLKLSKAKIGEGAGVQVSLTVKNSGNQPGYETVQLYVQDIESSLIRPVKELKAFEKIYLQPNEIKNLNFKLNASAFAFFDEMDMQWKTEPGVFKVHAGSSSRDIRLTADFKIVNTINDTIDIFID
ncbi:MAG: glycoside hydrolase family 3 C-terminal domain-containing protein [Calditrichaeota bacterium]|nr:glycoside hydrolase family 3 C-terminal domain-containing protein [Calditrichota bacterium]